MYTYRYIVRMSPSRIGQSKLFIDFAVDSGFRGIDIEKNFFIAIYYARHPI